MRAKTGRRQEESLENHDNLDFESIFQANSNVQKL
jgi:hypothetical protein